MNLSQTPGTGGPASSQPPGSLCRGCASQSRPGSLLGSGRLRARHVGFTTAQNTSVCGVYEREGREREVTSEPEHRALFLATSPTLFLAQLLKVSLSFPPSSFPPSHPPSLLSPSLLPPLPPPWLRVHSDPGRAGLSSRRKESDGPLQPRARSAALRSPPRRAAGWRREPQSESASHSARPQGSRGLASLAFCPSGDKAGFRHLLGVFRCPDAVPPTLLHASPGITCLPFPSAT